MMMTITTRMKTLNKARTRSQRSSENRMNSLRGRDSAMKKLVFGVVIMIVVISPALAGMGDGVGGGEFCKGCPSWRSPASSDPPPWWLPQSPVSGCYLVKERVATQRGHAVYQTRQVCG